MQAITYTHVGLLLLLDELGVKLSKPLRHLLAWLMVAPRSMHYTWLIGNGEDTNLAPSDCMYDRIIVTAGLREDYAKEAAKYLPIPVSDSE